MLVFIILLLFIKSSYASNISVGSVFFYNRNYRDCWNEDDLTRLRARRIFENIILPELSPEKINSKYVRRMINYYRRALRSVEKDVDKHNGVILKEALADTIGGHLRSETLPVVRFAYYAGYIPYRNARQMHILLDDIKKVLNTQGLGWRKPPKVSQWSNLTVAKIFVASGKLIDPCRYLVVKRDANSCIHLPYPKLDDYNDPSAIALPFKVGGLVSLTSPSSENVLLKYYTTVSRCILQTSPENCRHSDFVNFNNELWHWMKRDVAPHLADEKLYAAYGGVLRIAAAVQNYGKGLRRRSFYGEEDIQSKWLPWKMFTDASIYINADWMPQMYIIILIFTGIGLCLLQMCYTYMFYTPGRCHCIGRSCGKSHTPLSSKHSHAAAYSPTYSNTSSRTPPPPAFAPPPLQSLSQTASVPPQIVESQPRRRSDLFAKAQSSDSRKDIAYASVETSIPALLPSPESNKSNKSKSSASPKRSKRILNDHKSACVGTARTEKVYDLNENIEKYMSIIMSDYGSSDVGYTSSSERNSEGEEDGMHATVIDVGVGARNKRPSSPPKIDAQMAQLKIRKSSGTAQTTKVYSTSTTHSEETFRQEEMPTTETAMSDSSTSDRSVSTTSLSPERSRNFRDLAWARRVVSKQTIRDRLPRSTD